ncbi:MAG TPA: S8 family serine peptidase, partial [Niabella sp.]|nr:S8 family serine peptidase [Niabella sp.]
MSVQVSDQSFIEKFRALPFVKEVAPIWSGKKDTTAYLKTLVNISFSTAPRSVASPEYFGVAWDNIRQNNGQALHDSGYKGQGMEIAVIDAGFKDLMNNPILKNINIKGSKSFIYEKFNPFNYGNHGVYVTSCMATNKANSFVGTAPEAAYWLLMTEDEDTEFPVEEDYLVAALEYADSVGANAANISLGYIGFDKSFPAYKFEDMNGNTAFASRGANIAADKGLLVVVAAG